MADRAAEAAIKGLQKSMAEIIIQAGDRDFSDNSIKQDVGGYCGKFNTFTSEYKLEAGVMTKDHEKFYDALMAAQRFDAAAALAKNVGLK